MQITVKNAPKEYDVIIAGGGPAGCAAAIAAGRMGVKVLVIEAAACLGGMATVGLVSKWAPFDDMEKVIYRSIPLEILDRYKKKAGLPMEKYRWVELYPEMVKTVYDEMLAEAGVQVLFDSRVVDAVVEDGSIQALIVANKAGLTPYKAKTYIDCTGDADVATFSGVPFEMGDELGHLQPASLCFIIANCHLEKRGDKILGSGPKEGLWRNIIDSKKYPLLCKHFIPAYWGNGVLIANAGHLYSLDSTDPEAVSAAMVKGRQMAEQYLQALKDFEPEIFADACIVTTATGIGTRESRRIKGEYTITLEDYMARRSFDDEICRNSYHLDCHGKVPPSMQGMKLYQYTAGESHGIPWRCMIPLGVKNLLVSGRSVSMERAALASIRVMPNCLAMGEAAGIGAALTVKHDTDVRGVDVKEILSYIK